MQSTARADFLIMVKTFISDPLHSRISEFDSEFELDALALEFGKIERERSSDFATPYLRIPSRSHEHFRRETDKQRRPKHYGVARKG
jgi:hypothetical protein